MLRALTSSQDLGSSAVPSKETSLDTAAYTPQSMIDEQVPILESVQEGYHGDSSFTAHAHQIKVTLEATLPHSDLEFPRSSTSIEIDKNQGQDEGNAAAINTLIQSNDIGLGNKPLPPNELVLRLLRLAKTEEQRFFIDLPLFDRDEFIDMCRDIYFATEPVSLWTWICVNVGLYGLFGGIREENSKRLGTTLDALHAHRQVLKSNAEAALRSLRLCSEPSTESCRALAVLVSPYIQTMH
jgi:hypothetical protein